MASSSYDDRSYQYLQQQQQQQQFQQQQQDQQQQLQSNSNELNYFIGGGNLDLSWQDYEAIEQRKNLVQSRINTQQFNVTEDLLDSFSFGTSNDNKYSIGINQNQNQNIDLNNYSTSINFPNSNSNLNPSNLNDFNNSLPNYQSQSSVKASMFQSPPPPLPTNLQYLANQLQTPPLTQPDKSRQVQGIPHQQNHYPMPPVTNTASHVPTTRYQQPNYNNSTSSFNSNQFVNRNENLLPTPSLNGRDSQFVDLASHENNGADVSSFGQYPNSGVTGNTNENFVERRLDSNWNGLDSTHLENNNSLGINNQQSWVYPELSESIYDPPPTQSFLPSPPQTLSRLPNDSNLQSQNFIPRNGTSFSMGSNIQLPTSMFPNQPFQPLQQNQFHPLPLPLPLPANSNNLPLQNFFDSPPLLISPPNRGNNLILSPITSINGFALLEREQSYESSIYNSTNATMSPPNQISPPPPPALVLNSSRSQTNPNSESKRSRIEVNPSAIPPIQNKPTKSKSSGSTSKSNGSSTSDIPIKEPVTQRVEEEKDELDEEEEEEEEEEDEHVEKNGFRTKDSALSAKLGRKQNLDVDCYCSICGTIIARLILRARPAELAAPHSPHFTCLSCTPSDQSESYGSSSQSPEDASSSNYSPPPSTNQPILNMPNTAGNLATGKTKHANPTFRKKYKRTQDEITSCDVCLRDIAFGAVINDSTSVPVSFPVEVVCNNCNEKYRRCTDCGGGGGIRLGVGKWRCKEMFSQGRKTCKLSHLRLGRFEDMTYEVWKVADIPLEEMRELEEKVREIFVATLLSAMAIPEILERASVQTGIATMKNYAQVEAFAASGFNNLSKMLLVDVEATRSIRRYVALRFCVPNPRKGLKASKDIIDPVLDENYVVLRPSQELVGFVLAEYDFPYQTLFTSVVVPWATGDTLDATTALLQKLLGRVESDRIELNEQQVSLGSDLKFGALLHVWTMMFFVKDSRMRVHMEKKRGFSLFADYIKKYPDTDLRAFPPIRDTYVPPQALPYWDLLIKRAGPNVFISRRKDEDLKGKKKKEKAEQMRILAEKGIVLE